MIRLRKHPDATWTKPYRDIFLNEDEFIRFEGVSFLERKRNSLFFKGERGELLQVTVCADEIIRITVYPGGKLKTRDMIFSGARGEYSLFDYKLNFTDFTFSEKQSLFEINTGKLKLFVNKNPLGIFLEKESGETLLESVPEGMKYKKLSGGGFETLSFFNNSGEDYFFGFGGRTQKPSRKGKTFDSYHIKVEQTRGDYGGFPLPYFLNPAGYGFLLHNPCPHAYFDLGREFQDRWFVHTPGGLLDFYLLGGGDFTGINRNYCALTGYPTLPPKWLFGFWVSQAEEGDVDFFIETAERLRKEKWPFDVMVLDLFWRGGKLNKRLEGEGGSNLDWDIQNFGDGKKLIHFLNKIRARVCLHLNVTMFSGNILKEGLGKGFLRKVEEDIVVPRITSPKAESWCWSLHSKRVWDGADLWWTDNSERVDGALENGLPSRSLFGQLWNKFLFDGMEKEGFNGRLVLSRGGWFGAQKNTLTWPGDTASGVDRLKEDLYWHINCSTSGIPFNTVDQGGFTFRGGKKDDGVMHSDENIIRRVANGFLLFTVPRIHGKKKYPWQYNERVRKIYRYFLELRYRMFPYIYSYIVLCHKTGVPPYRPLFWNYPDDKHALTVDDQLLCGDWLMFAPVTDEGYVEREVYLPGGNWINAWTLEEDAGNRWIMVDAPLCDISGMPFFIKKGAVLPFRPLKQYNTEESEKELMLHIFPEDAGEERFYDDDITSYTIRYKRTSEALNVSMDNPLKARRKIHVIAHCGSKKNENNHNIDILCPFSSGDVRSILLDGGGSSEVEFSLKGGTEGISSR